MLLWLLRGRYSRAHDYMLVLLPRPLGRSATRSQALTTSILVSHTVFLKVKRIPHHHPRSPINRIMQSYPIDRPVVLGEARQCDGNSGSIPVSLSDGKPTQARFEMRESGSQVARKSKNRLRWLPDRKQRPMKIGRTAAAAERERSFEGRWSVRVGEVQAGACTRKRRCAKDVQAKRSVQGEAILQFQCTL
jgi:hypothetical protein